MTNANESAFPNLVQTPVKDCEGRITSYRPNTIGGLTKREYFAAMAMQGLIGKIWGHVNGYDGKGNKPENCSDANECAHLSVIYADRLLAELEKNNE